MPRAVAVEAPAFAPPGPGCPERRNEPHSSFVVALCDVVCESHVSSSDEECRMSWRSMLGTGRPRVVLASAVALAAAAIIAAAGGSAAGGATSASSPTDLRRLPLGDGKVTLAGPRRGYVWSCQSPNPERARRAGRRAVDRQARRHLRRDGQGDGRRVGRLAAGERQHQAHEGRRAGRRQRPADQPHDRYLPDRRGRRRLPLRPQPERDPRPEPQLDAAAGQARRRGVVREPRRDRRRAQRRGDLQRVGRRGPRRRRARGARRLLGASGALGPLPLPLDAAVPVAAPARDAPVVAVRLGAGRLPDLRPARPRRQALLQRPTSTPATA